ncbi:MAG: preprotein translocase subunit SecG [Nitrospirae bacterium RIFCSPLOWO2_02_42_7]|nr:MAG: preprotein translocase subunit SecG [Nitrospirae bacterium RIFCSPLOWO2_02_42_7]
MTVLLIIIHVLVSLFLIGIVLIQSGKGAEIGAVFGGASSQTIFGSRGPGSFLNKLTTIAAIVFIVTSFSLAFFGKREGRSSSSVIPEQSAPSAPANTTGQPFPSIPDVPLMPSEPAAK